MYFATFFTWDALGNCWFVELGQVTMSEINLARSLYLIGAFNCFTIGMDPVALSIRQLRVVLEKCADWCLSQGVSIFLLLLLFQIAVWKLLAPSAPRCVPEPVSVLLAIFHLVSCPKFL